MLNGKYIPLDAALESIMASSAYLSNLSHASACIWAGEAMDLMAVPAMFMKKVTDGNVELNHPAPVPIVGYRGQLPPDVYKIVQVRDCASRRALRRTTNTFHKAHNNYIRVHNTNSTDIEGDEGSDLEGGAWQQNAYNNTGPVNWQGVGTYDTNGYFIFTSFEEGRVEISYLAFPMDQDGVPLIPDDEKIKMAIGAYIKMNHYNRLWEAGDLPNNVMQKVEQEWLWRVGSGTTRARNMNSDGLESMKNIILRLVPKVNGAHRNFFENVGNQEQFLRHNSGWSNLP